MLSWTFTLHLRTSRCCHSRKRKQCHCSQTWWKSSPLPKDTEKSSCCAYRIDVGLPIGINHFYCFNTEREKNIRVKVKLFLTHGPNVEIYIYVALEIYTHVNGFSQYSLNIVTIISRTIFAYKTNIIITLKSVIYLCWSRQNILTRNRENISSYTLFILF